MASTAGLVGELERAADGVVGGARVLRSQRCGKLVAQPVVVERDVDAADHGDAEGASEQSGGVVDGGADAGLGLRHDPHDRLGRGCADEPHAAPAEQHLADDLEVAGCCVCGGDPGEEDGEEDQTDGDDLLGAEAHSELGPEHRHDPHGERDRQQADTRGEGPVAFEELEVLGDQEAEACYPEEGDGDGTAGGGEAKVAEEADVEHRLRCAALAEDEDAEQRRCDREAREGAAAAPAVAGGLDQRVGQQCDRGAREHESRDVGLVCARIA